MDKLVPLLTALVAGLFALSVLDQYLERRRPYQLLWTGGLGLYCLASLMSLAWALWGPREVVFRAWYYTGGMLVAAYLGMGSLYLAAPGRAARAALALLLVATVAGGVLAFATPLGGDVALMGGGAMASRVQVDGATVRLFPAHVTALTVLLNTAGSLALIGGALHSAWSFWRRRARAYRVVSNALIAAGAFVSAAGGTLEGLGVPSPHNTALLVGVVIIYAGFLRSREVFQTYRLPFFGRGDKDVWGLVLIMAGVAAWVPYTVLKYGMGQEVEVLPYLAVHLAGVVPGFLLRRRALLMRLLSRQGRPG